MSAEVISVERVVVSPSGAEFRHAGAFRRHEYQYHLGKARTKITIRKAKGQGE